MIPFYLVVVILASLGSLLVILAVFKTKTNVYIGEETLLIKLKLVENIRVIQPVHNDWTSQ